MILKDKNIVIIGGTSGIGLAATHYFRQQGASLVVTGKNDAHIDALKETIDSHITIVANDATQKSGTTEAIEKCVSIYGSLDGLYHVAGGSGRSFGDGPLHEMTLDAWHKTLDLNLTSVMLSNQAAIVHWMKNSQRGTILNTTSVLAFSPSAQYFHTHAYAAAKAAVVGFTKSIAAYYAKENIRVNALAPSLVASPMSQRALGNQDIMNYIKEKQPLDGGRVGLPEDLNGIAAYFMSDLSKFTTGQIVSIDGGWTIS
jgi:NAD(P)-dependent dehydrogenase (short-subunit alcohol dehydrogenase family)